MTIKNIPIIDIFAGPGGLGEGFSAFQKKQSFPFEIKLSIEKDKDAHQTLTLRSFFRKFCKGKVPSRYYKFIKQNKVKNINDLLDHYPEITSEIRNEVKQAELGGKKFPEEIIDSWIRQSLQENDRWVLIGGPPCQAYSMAGRSKNRSLKGYKAEKDNRNFLYLEYLRIIANHWPAIFVMENVRGILSSKVKKKNIFPKILKDLSSPASVFNGDAPNRRHTYRIFSLVMPYSNGDLFKNPEFKPSDFIIKSEDYGIPQARHRVILLGIRNDLGDVVPRTLKKKKKVSTAEVLDDLPVLRSGISRGQDSDIGWFNVISSIKDEKWVQELENEQLRDEILNLLKRLKIPKSQRGREFIPVDPNCGYNKGWFHDRKLKGVCNSVSKEHMREDLKRYFFASTFASVTGRSPLINEFPKQLIPQHKNLTNSKGPIAFADRFRVQVRNKPSTTVMSHLSKDGHYYIHYDPLQCRSLTVREAARLQTFPDNYCFMGNRTAQYIQVGNAVPPLLAAQIADIVYDLLRRAN